ncbi:tetratricopeptide repeat protein [Myxococcaceae bacterium GXIMD 01537]
MERPRVPFLWVLAALAIGGLARWLTAPPAAQRPALSRLERLEHDTRPSDAAGQARLATALLREAERTGDPNLFHRTLFAAQQALELDPERTDASKVVLRVLHHGHQFQEMLDGARALAEKHPRDAFFPGLMGDALLELGRYDEAAAAYQRMVDLKPSSATYTRIGILRLVEGDGPGAIDVLKLAATSADQTDAFAVANCLSELGDAYLALGEPDTALEYYTVALSRDPSLARAHVGRGHVLRARGTLPEAISEYEAALKSRARADVRAFLADALSAAGRTPEAARQYEQALEESRDDARVHAQLLLDLGRDTSHAETLARAEYARRKDVFTEGVLAYALVVGGKQEEAQASIGRALRLGTRDARLSYAAGLTASARGDLPAAHGHLTAALRGFPPLPPAQQIRARTLLDTGARAALAPQRAEPIP